MSKNKRRGSGILLHISALPSKYGIGNFGKPAYEFVDFLSSAGQKYWQILPLTIAGAGNSPYSSNSAFALNPNFVDLESLVAQNLLLPSELQCAEIQTTRVNYQKVQRVRTQLLKKAYSRFDANDERFVKFCERQAYLDYAIFMTLKIAHGGAPFCDWHDQYKFQKPAAIKRLREQQGDTIGFFLFEQYILFEQWQRLKAYANSNGVRIIGDMPIYLDYDSVEVWKNPKLVQLEASLKPSRVAGVPPDYFSSDGQLWGNPLYDWDYHKKTKYAWWKKRILHATSIFDLVRIDHFRGFYEYYSIEAGAKTAREGEWRKGCGIDLFESLPRTTKAHLIAEDLGYLDQAALDFFAACDFPGMRVLQFAFDGNPNNPHLPQNHTQNSIVYTGTHDNDTLKGWLTKASAGTKQQIIKTAKALNIKFEKKPKTAQQLCDLMIAMAAKSPADLCIIPLADHLKQGTKYRFNEPGTVSKANWSYRVANIPTELAAQIKTQTKR